MSGDHGLSDLRFEGYGHGELAAQVDALRNGQGSEGLYRAASALMYLAQSLAKTDVTLRQELAKIGVEWQGQAAEGGTAATESASIYAEDAVKPVAGSAGGVDNQSDSFTHTRNSAPDSGTLRGPTEQSTVDQVAGFFGHTTDHARQVEATNAARDQAIADLNGYNASSQDALNRYRPLPVPPGMELNAQPVRDGTSVSSVGGFGGGAGGIGPGGVPGGPGTGGVPGVPGAGGPFGLPGGAPPPGANTGIGPVGPTPGVPPAATPGVLPGGLRPGMNPLFMAETAALMGAGGAGAAAGGAEQERLARGAGRAGGPPGSPASAAKGGVPVAGVPDEEARAARNAERFGAKPGRPTGSIMQPATGSARREEDEEHVRKYGIDSGDVFDDERTVAPPALGEDDE